MKMIKLSILAAGVLGAVGLMGMQSASAAPKAEITAEARADQHLRRAEAFRASLKPAQRDALLKASQGWESLAQDPEKLMVRVEKDIARILTPAQAREFMNVIDPGISGGGVYRPWICWANSKLSVMFSMIGIIGCPTDTAEDAFYSAYLASVYANTCLVEHAGSCDIAAYSALDAYTSWSQIVGTCDVADTAMYTCLMTYAGCGGSW